MIDSHCHLDDQRYADDLPQVIENAAVNGVSHIITVCSSLDEVPIITDIIQRFENVYASVGVHPEVIERTGEYFGVDDIMPFIKDNPKIVAIGETGLDFHYSTNHKDKQIQTFIGHIESSRLTGKPLCVHTRDADDDCVQILYEQYAKQPFKAVLHCFSGSEKLMKCVIDLDFYYSFGGIVTFDKSGITQNACKTMPLNRLLLETDGPYLAPPPYRGKRNEPAYTKIIAEAIAKIRGLTLGEIDEITTKNTRKLFSI